MAKGQQKTNKESKKPKKAAPVSAAPVSSSAYEPVRSAVTTAVLPKGKAKNKPAF